MAAQERKTAPGGEGRTDPSTGGGGGGGPSTASLMGGAALIGAAAGYALLAMKFKNFSSASSALPEYRAAQAFSKEWSRSAAPAFEEGSTKALDQAAGAAQGAQRAAREEYARWKEQSQRHQQEAQQRRQQQRDAIGPPAWALRELGLPEATGDRPLTLAEAKAAYRQRAKSVHPDTGGTGVADDAAFQRLTEALRAVEPHTTSKK